MFEDLQKEITMQGQHLVLQPAICFRKVWVENYHEEWLEDKRVSLPYDMFFSSLQNNHAQQNNWSTLDIWL